MFRTSASVFALIAGVTALTSPAFAADMLRPSYHPGFGQTIAAPVDESNFTVGVEVGRMTAKSHEFVYDGGHKLSELIWETDNATTVGITATGRTIGGLETRLRGSFTVQDDSYMEDYDWLAGRLGFVGYNDWTHASYHEDTQLDHAFSLDAQVSKRVVGRGKPIGLNLLGGVRHTDIKWTAYGGRYVYSENGLHDSVGVFPDGEAGISYQQQFTSPYVGLEVGADTGRFSARAAGLLGMPVFSGAEDDHWARRLNFDDDTGGHYMIGLEAQAAFDVTSHFGLTAGVRHERYTNSKGKSRVEDTTTGGTGFLGDDSAGAAHEQTNITLGGYLKF